jgi:hypothetical protein
MKIIHSFDESTYLVIQWTDIYPRYSEGLLKRFDSEIECPPLAEERLAA